MNVMTSLGDVARSEGDPKVVTTGPSSLGGADRLARLLGWFSYGLGVAELAAAPSIARTLGLEGQERLIRIYGARELSAGMLSLSIDTKIGIASRIVGDVIDLATLAAAKGDARQQANRTTALAVVAGITALDVLCYAMLQKRHGRDAAARADYSDRSGLPKGIEASRGAARHIFQTPPDYRAPPQLAGTAGAAAR